MTATGEKAGARTLEDWAKHFRVALLPGAQEELLAYGRLLLAWGVRINLTAAKSLEALIADHFSDSFAIAARLGSRAGTPVKLIDVGSGGGLPAIPLALLRPGDRMTLVEATGKKVAFLRTAVRELRLGDRLEVVHGRIESRGGERGGLEGTSGAAFQGTFEGRFDVATSRAMLAPPEWLGLGRRLVRIGGTVFCLGTAAVEVVGEGLTLIDQAAYRSRHGHERWVAELQRST